MISQSQVRRFHHAAKMMEADMDEAYRTCCQRFGSETAGVLLVALLRQQCNGSGRWPPPDDLEMKVNEFLKDKGLLDEAD
jgi:hypothetical protein